MFLRKAGQWFSAIGATLSLLVLLVRYRRRHGVIHEPSPQGDGTLRALLLHRDLSFTGDVPRSLLCLAKNTRKGPVRFSVASFQAPGHRMTEAFSEVGIIPQCVGDDGCLRPTRRIGRLIESDGIDVVVATSFKAYLCAKAATRATGIRVIFWAHAVQGIVEGRIRRKLLSILSRNDPMLFCSEAVKRSQRPARHRGPVEVAYNGVEDVIGHADPSLYAWDMRRNLGVPPEAPILAYHSDFTGWRDHATLIEAMHRLARRGLEAHLMLIGGGPSIDTIRAIATAGPAASRIHFLGARSDARRILELIDIYIHTTQDEGHAPAVMEAMLAGRPIIASRDGALVEYIDDGKNGVLVNPGDPADLAEAIARLASDRWTANTLGVAARQRGLSLFNVSTFAANICSFIQRCYPNFIPQAEASKQVLARIGGGESGLAAVG